MISIELSGKVIFITGAMGAIAEYIVKRLVAGGRNSGTGRYQAGGPGRENSSGMADSRFQVCLFLRRRNRRAFVESGRQGVVPAFSRMDTVLGHAGGCGLHPFANTTEAEYERIFRVNYFAQTYLARSVFAEWIERQIPGHLIFTSSYVARIPHTQIPSYASAKAALENLARCLALEYAATGIRVSVVSPGNVAAGSSLKVFEEDASYRQFVLRIGLGRRNSPESIADTFVFLCSRLANEINGQILSPDYGAGIGNRL